MPMLVSRLLYTIPAMGRSLRRVIPPKDPLLPTILILMSISFTKGALHTGTWGRTLESTLESTLLWGPSYLTVRSTDSHGHMGAVCTTTVDGVACAGSIRIVETDRSVRSATNFHRPFNSPCIWLNAARLAPINGAGTAPLVPWWAAPSVPQTCGHPSICLPVQSLTVPSFWPHSSLPLE